MYNDDWQSKFLASAAAKQRWPALQQQALLPLKQLQSQRMGSMGQQKTASCCQPWQMILILILSTACTSSSSRDWGRDRRNSIKGWSGVGVQGRSNVLLGISPQHLNVQRIPNLHQHQQQQQGHPKCTSNPDTPTSSTAQGAGSVGDSKPTAFRCQVNKP